MIRIADPRWLLLMPVLALPLVYAWRGGAFHFGPQRKRLALALRCLLMALIVLGLAGLSVTLPRGRQAAVFVADLSASNMHNRASMEHTIVAAENRQPAGDAIGVVAMGRDAAVEQPASPNAQFDHFAASVNPNNTDIERSLELAAATLPEGYRRRVVLMSDGRQNVGNGVAAASLLRTQGVRVDVLPEPSRSGPDVRVDSLQAPTSLHTHESFALTLTLHSTVRTAARIDLYRDHQLVADRRVEVAPGESSLSFAEPELAVGTHVYDVHIMPTVDSVPENNMGSALVSVQGSPRVLVVALTATEAASVMQGLRSTGIGVDFRDPTHVPSTLAFLERYAGVVLVDTPASALDPALQAQLVPYVRDLGRGLVVLGGENAYGLGAYGHTPLETLLPVKTELPKRRQIPSVAVVLIIESLEAQLPVNISKSAGMGVIQLLSEQDQIAVNDAPDNGTPGWATPLQHPLNKALIFDAISQMQPGDPGSYSPYLKASYAVLHASHARIKHIILLGDGDAHSPSYRLLVREIHARGITVSTVATGATTDLDYATMRNIARWGGGRYYQADNPATIPRIFLREAKNLARSAVVSGTFFPRKLSSNPMIRDLRGVPSLSGYVATAAKPAAEVVLASNHHDPLLATWQYGLGRTVAWTSDAAGLWTKRWLTAPGANRFWANLVTWTLPASTVNQLYVESSSEAGVAHVAVDTPQSLGLSPTVTVGVVSPDLQTSHIRLDPVAPDQYRGSFPAPDQGSYFVSVQARGNGRVETGQSGVNVPYSAEYRTIGTDPATLRAIARAGGGSVISGPGDVWRDNLAPVNDQYSLTAILWLAAVLLLPVDVALRRLVVRRWDRAGWVGEAPSRDVPRLALGRLPRLGAPRLRAATGAGHPSPLRPTAPPSSRTSPGRTAAPPSRAAVPQPSTASRLLEAKRRRQAEAAQSGGA